MINNNDSYHLLNGANHWAENTYTHIYFFLFFFLIEVELIYNTVLVSDVQQSDLVIHIHIFSDYFPFRLL